QGNALESSLRQKVHRLKACLISQVAPFAATTFLTLLNDRCSRDQKRAVKPLRTRNGEIRHLCAPVAICQQSDSGPSLAICRSFDLITCSKFTIEHQPKTAFAPSINSQAWTRRKIGRDLHALIQSQTQRVLH